MLPKFKKKSPINLQGRISVNLLAIALCNHAMTVIIKKCVLSQVHFCSKFRAGVRRGGGKMAMVAANFWQGRRIWGARWAMRAIASPRF